ncbi:MAG: UDP-2,3-diacylglucosamine diphosphatase [Bacteroidales bacterium]|nr:UDP-2,3-diacylglucosamine diphosphatase [Bacteroidales bacterium]
MQDKGLYFITDAHLGAGADTLEREKALCQLLDDIAPKAAKVVFLGDMFDFWFTYRHVVPKGYTRLLGRMAQMSDAGIEMHFFVGNHDMWMFDYLQKEMGIVMHDEPEVMVFDGKRFLVGHGDGLGHLDRTYDILRWIFRNRVNQRLFSILPEWMTFGIAARWSQKHRSGKLRKKPEILEFQGDDNEGIILYCKERMMKEHFDYCVFGHRHTPLVKEISTPEGVTATYCNVGDWLIHRNYAVYADGELSLQER